MENCKAFDSADDAWAWIAKAWPGIDSYDRARTQLHMCTGQEMTNLDIHFFPFFNIREVPGDKKGYPYMTNDDDELQRSRAFHTFGHPAYDAGCARYLFDKYGFVNAFSAYESKRLEDNQGVKPPPRFNSDNYPPLSVQYQTPPTGGETAGPTNDPDTAKMPAPAARDDTASRMSVDGRSNAMDDGHTIADSTKDLRGLSLDEDAELNEPVAKKSRGANDHIMDVDAANVDNTSEKSPDLLSFGGKDDETIVSGTEVPVECSQNDRFGLVVFCPPFVTTHDAKSFLSPYLAAEPNVIALCRFQDRFAILVTGSSLLIISLGNSLASDDSKTIFGHPIEVESLDANDWTHVVPLPLNENAERLAENGTVQALKARCPASQYTPFAEAINNSASSDDVFAFYLGLLENAKSNDSGTAKSA